MIDYSNPNLTLTINDDRMRRIPKIIINDMSIPSSNKKESHYAIVVHALEHQCKKIKK